MILRLVLKRAKTFRRCSIYALIIHYPKFWSLSASLSVNIIVRTDTSLGVMAK